MKKMLGKSLTAMKGAGRSAVSAFGTKFAAAAASAVIALGSLGLAEPARASGIPVVDLAAITQMITEFQQMLKEYDQLVRQYNMIEGKFDRAYDATTWSRTAAEDSDRSDMFSRVATSRYLNMLPEALDETIVAIRTNGASVLPAGAQQLYREFGLGDACERASSLAQARCYRRAALNALKLYSYSQGESTALKRRSAIQEMLSSIGETKTPKQAADLQQRMIQEQVSLQNERIRMEILRTKFDQEEKLLEMEHQANLDRLFFQPGS